MNLILLLLTSKCLDFDVSRLGRVLYVVVPFVAPAEPVVLLNLSQVELKQRFLTFLAVVLHIMGNITVFQMIRFDFFANLKLMKLVLQGCHSFDVGEDFIVIVPHS